MTHEFAIRLGDKVIPIGSFDYQDGFAITIDGHDLLGVDLFYMGSPEEEDISDPNPGAPAVPHINVGHWPDGEEWELIAHLPVPETST